MCGICGFVTSLQKQEDDLIKKMTQALHHRGPDFQSDQSFHCGDNWVAMGHARLSILDLSPLGNQPMAFQNLTIVFNGEVYNYREIRSELSVLGYEFDSDSDSEVILKGFHYWGSKVLDRMIGMFSIAILDKQKEELFIARDRVGVKPLFYSLVNGEFFFASELKALRQNNRFDTTLDDNTIYQYLHFGYFPEPNTVYRDTFKVRPGHFGIYNLKLKTLEFTCYWSPEKFHNLPKIHKDEDDVLIELEELFVSAFNYRMVSDVPVGVFLSGGYDSSLVAAILQKTNKSRIKTFTIGFGEKEFNEAEEAKIIAKHLGTDHHEYYCTPADGMDIIPELGNLYDEPFGDSSAVPTLLLSRFCKQHVSVALSADGGDEVFAGYNNYSSFYSLVSQLQAIQKTSSGLIKFLAQMVNSARIYNFWHPKKAHLYSIAIEYLINNDLKSLLTKYRYQNKTSFIGSMFKELPLLPNSSFDGLRNLENIIDPIENSQVLDLMTYLPGDILTKVDRATMSVSLEGREPLLDHRIIEYAATIPTEMHFSRGNQKHLLKQVVHKYIPKELMERPKKGFGIPVKNWMRNELKDLTLDTLSEETIKRNGLFNTKKVVSLRDDYLNGNDANFELVWYLLTFELWDKAK